ncbi:hypothetical protein B0H19DRAFT_1083216 [Mycena capillaripes]|nr:hypothetical protein B0H19DRAFT_1083216 [Mycena capillaripes]
MAQTIDPRLREVGCPPSKVQVTFGTLQVHTSYFLRTPAAAGPSAGATFVPDPNEGVGAGGCHVRHTARLRWRCAICLEVLKAHEPGWTPRTYSVASTRIFLNLKELTLSAHKYNGATWSEFQQNSALELQLRSGLRTRTSHDRRTVYETPPFTFPITLAPSPEDLTLPVGVDPQESAVVFRGGRAPFPVLLLFRFSRLLFWWLLFSAAHHPTLASETHAPPTGVISMGSTRSDRGAMHSSCRLWGISGAIKNGSRTGAAGNFLAPTHGPFTEHGSSVLYSAFARTAPSGAFAGVVTHRFPVGVSVILSVLLLSPVVIAIKYKGSGPILACPSAITRPQRRTATPVLSTSAIRARSPAPDFPAKLQPSIFTKPFFVMVDPVHPYHLCIALDSAQDMRSLLAMWNTGLRTIGMKESNGDVFDLSANDSISAAHARSSHPLGTQTGAYARGGAAWPGRRD